MPLMNPGPKANHFETVKKDGQKPLSKNKLYCNYKNAAQESRPKIKYLELHN